MPVRESRKPTANSGPQAETATFPNRHHIRQGTPRSTELQDEFSRDILQFAGRAGIVAGEFAEQPAVRFGTDGGDKRADSRIVARARGEAEIVRFVANGEEFETGIFADETHANSHVGPAATNRFGDSPMIARLTAGLIAIFEQFVETLPGPRPGFAPHPP